MPKSLFAALGATLLLTLASSCASGARQSADATEVASSPTPRIDHRIWRAAHELCVEGQAWAEQAAPFDRLPARAKAVVRPPVWKLSRCSAGMAVRFRSDATSLDVRWRLGGDRLALPHMPATGVSGLDLYVQELGRLRWLATGFPFGQKNELKIVSGLDGTMREFVLYLPLYNSIEELEIGVAPGFQLSPWPREDAPRPIVFYGTSITQGACASRPGACHVAILGRRLDRPVINLGFSGNGTLDLDFAPLLAEIDAAVYVLDCLPNMHAALVRARLAPFVRALRAKRPTTPILIVEDRRYADAYLRSDRRRRSESSWRACRESFETLRADGVRGLHYVRGAALLGEDSEDTVDGSHPSDLGFQRMAEVFADALYEVL